MKKTIFVVLAISIPGAQAHDMWLEREAGAFTLFQGHRHSGHAGAERIPYSPGFVQSALCREADGAIRELPVPSDYPARFEADCTAIVVTTSSGPWTRTVRGTRQQPPSEVTGVIASWLSFESVKRLADGGEAPMRPLSQALELTPVNDPFELQPGEKLRLLVTYQGEPREGVAVAYHGDVRGVSSQQGRINIRLRHTGLQLISASFEGPSGEPGIDKTVHAANLHFVLPAYTSR